MKSLLVKTKKLFSEERWDIDYHLPPIEIQEYNQALLKELKGCVDVITEKRNPTLEPEKTFLYVDISSIDIVTGMITNPQELLGEEAPSRARKVIRAGDIIISTCRPTRGAIAVVPKSLDNQICSTGFSVIRARKDVSNLYLHFILRSDVAREQFRKFSTGSSYPAILDDDVKKTIVPMPEYRRQVEIASMVTEQTKIRNKRITETNKAWEINLIEYLSQIKQM